MIHHKSLQVPAHGSFLVQLGFDVLNVELNLSHGHEQLPQCWRCAIISLYCKEIFKICC